MGVGGDAAAFAGRRHLFRESDPHADQLVSQAQAAQLTDPATARRPWARVDHIVTDQAPWVPILNQASTAFVSARIANFQESPIYGPLLDQMWVR